MVMKHFDVYAELVKNTTDFDAAYSKRKVEAHDEAVRCSRRRPRTCCTRPEGVRGEALPTLKKHRNMARDLGKGGDDGRGERQGAQAAEVQETIGSS